MSTHPRTIRCRGNCNPRSRQSGALKCRLGSYCYEIEITLGYIAHPELGPVVCPAGSIGQPRLERGSHWCREAQGMGAVTGGKTLAQWLFSNDWPQWRRHDNPHAVST